MYKIVNKKIKVHMVIVLIIAQFFLLNLSVHAEIAPPSATAGEESIEVSSFQSGATLKLYKVNGTLVATANSVNTATYKFNNVVPDSNYYYVTQTVGGNESLNSPFVNSTLRTPNVSGGIGYVDVTNVYSGAVVKLYNSSAAVVPITATNQGNGTFRFTGVTPGGGYYVVQEINSVQSSPSSMVTVDPDIPAAPTATAGEEYIVVSNFQSGATLKLYKVNGTLVATANSVTTLTYKFEAVVPDSNYYYVTQTVGGNESLNSPFLSSTLRTPSASGGIGYVDVTNVYSGAVVKLYNSSAAVVPITATNQGNGTFRFTGVTPGGGYYVVQEINSVQSSPSSMVSVAPDIPAAPTATAGEESIEVSNFQSGATLKLYKVNGGALVSTENNVNASTYKFENVVPDSNCYYVTQTIGGNESVNSSFENSTLRTPIANGGINYVDVTNVYPSTVVKLYNLSGTMVSSAPTDQGNGTFRFTGVATGKEYYVEQEINNVKSLASNVVIVGNIVLLPTNNSINISVDSELILTFDINITAVAGKDIVIKRAVDDSIVETMEANDFTKVSVSNGTVIINPTENLYYGTGYYVQIDAGAFRDSNNEYYDGISDNSTWNFTTEIKSEVTAKNSDELKYYIMNSNVAIINLVNGTQYNYAGGTITRELTVNGNGATIIAGTGVNDTIIRSDDITVQSSALGNYANVKTFLKVEGVASKLTLNNITLKNGTNKNGTNNLDDGIFAVINVKTAASLSMDNVTILDFHNNPTAGNNLSFGIHSEPGSLSTTIINSKFDSSNAFRNAIAIRKGQMDIRNNIFEGTDYPARLRQSDGYEYAMYIYGGNGQITGNNITGYDSTTQLGYASAGISVIGFYSTDVTIQNNSLSYNESGIDVTRTWSPWSSNTNMRVNGLTLISSEDAYTIGEALKSANKQDYVSVSFDQNDEVKLTNSVGADYFAVYGGYRSPYIKVDSKTLTSAKIVLPSGEIDAINAATDIEFEKQLQGESTWTSITAIQGTAKTEFNLSLEVDKLYKVRAKLKHLSADDVPPRELITYSNPVAINTNRVPQAPTNPVQNDTSNTFGWTKVYGYENISDYEYSLNGGNTWTTVTANPQTIPDSYYAIGAVQVRVKADATAGTQSGAALSSTAQYTATPSPSSDEPTTPTQPAEEVRVVDVVVVDGNASTTSVQVPIVRTTDSTGAVVDTVKIDEKKATETVENALKSKSDVATLVVTDIPNKNADKVDVQVPKVSMTKLGDSKIGLNIDTEKADLQLPKETIDAMKDKDIKIEISEVKDAAKVAETKGVLIKLAADSEIVGTPLVIETNFSARTKITIPVKSQYWPKDNNNMPRFIASLGVLIQHSDGENVIDRGEVEYDKNGNPIGVSVWVEKFSTFTLLKMSFEDFDGTTIVSDKKYMQDKVWTVSFSKELEPATVNSDNVFVIDREGNKYEVTLKTEGKSIKITPVNYYPLGKTLYLYVTKDVKAVTGESQGKSTRYGFTIGNIALNTNKSGDFKNIAVDKEWLVGFNQKLDGTTLSKIKVYDENCNEISVNMSIYNDIYVKIVPVKAYKGAMTYYIIVEEATSVTGKKLSLPEWIKFKIK
jgi:hypothetical protein